ncbi:aspartyl-phosphate phosphatase Spo0E family protein [Clostridium fungisolvens]|uniref:Spo0E like sporulation regulatory protein n=1 Tax=Clostridium fungisolvens TaxID=1604897 RepID=A0A6V8SI83_9CLOT|nr:aspartyl-phosphate phosphatase Spo0E family protein [Clostridium fungisolvens]GFP76944.1 hypothetical protein bsdtw1_03056 [Clostridium fungisolvens]
MAELEDLLKDIDKLRERLQLLIEKKQWNLVDAEVVAASKALNFALNQYNMFLKEKIGE